MKNKTPQTDLTKYLQQMTDIRAKMGRVDNYFYHGMEDFVLRAGKQYEIDHDKLFQIPRGIPRECYKNAFDIALMSDGEYRYVEGYAAGVIPVNHAWVVDSAGVIYEPTWTEKNDPWAYHGVEIPISTVILIQDLTGHYGVIDAWEAKWPLLRKEYKPNWEEVELL